MSAPLLTTKLYPPQARSNIVPRPRLTDQLIEGLNRKLILISAPAGFGKSTLLAEWRAGREGDQMPMAWVSLDSGDSDPARFWSYVVSALESIHPGFGNEVSKMLLSPDFPPLEELLNTLINEVSSTECEFALVLDDYYLIDSQLVHDGITYLLEHAPPHMHLVIISRVDPPFPLNRLRARGELVELRGTDLRFTRSET